MRILILPDLTTTRALLDGLEDALGLPRVPTEADITRVGGGIHVPLAEIQASRSWQTYGTPYQHSDGRGALLYHEALLRPLEGRSVRVGAGTRTIREADAVTLSTQTERDAWMQRTRR